MGVGHAIDRAQTEEADSCRGSSQAGRQRFAKDSFADQLRSCSLILLRTRLRYRSPGVNGESSLDGSVDYFCL